MKNVLSIFLFFVLIFWMSPFVIADNVIPARAVVVFDLSKISETQPALIYFSQKPKIIGGFIKEIGKPIDQLNWNVIYTCCKKFREVEAADCDRWISRKNQKLVVFVLHKNSILIKKISILEESRESEIIGDMKTLFQNISLAKELEAPVQVSFKEYILKKARGKLKISVTISEDDSGKMNPTDDVVASREMPSNPKNERQNAEEKGAEEGLSIELITGGSEHFFLSADIPIGALEDAKFVGSKDEGLAVEPADTPKSIYLGINIQFVDVIKKMDIKPPFLKLMMQFSKTPFDSIGIGLGWNLPKFHIFEKIGFQTDLICIFGGIFWAKESDSSNPENKLRSQLRWGLSYDLTKLTGWLKK